MSSPRVLCYGVGVDSTALLVELESRGVEQGNVTKCEMGVVETEHGHGKTLKGSPPARNRTWI